MSEVHVMLMLILFIWGMVVLTSASCCVKVLNDHSSREDSSLSRAMTCLKYMSCWCWSYSSEEWLSWLQLHAVWRSWMTIPPEKTHHSLELWHVWSACHAAADLIHLRNGCLDFSFMLCEGPEWPFLQRRLITLYNNGLLFLLTHPGIGWHKVVRADILCTFRQCWSVSTSVPQLWSCWLHTTPCYFPWKLLRQKLIGSGWRIIWPEG